MTDIRPHLPQESDNARPSLAQNYIIVYIIRRMRAARLAPYGHYDAPLGSLPRPASGSGAAFPAEPWSDETGIGVATGEGQ
jgi:hypothetical protein